MIEVRRDHDGELCGFVHRSDHGWDALTVFGGVLGTHETQLKAHDEVLAIGLASLAERWWYREAPSADWQVVCIQEASPRSVRLALDYYSMPGVPTVTLTTEQLASGGAALRLDR